MRWRLPGAPVVLIPEEDTAKRKTNPAGTKDGS